MNNILFIYTYLHYVCIILYNKLLLQELSLRLFMKRGWWFVETNFLFDIWWTWKSTCINLSWDFVLDVECKQEYKSKTWPKFWKMSWNSEIIIFFLYVCFLRRWKMVLHRILKCSMQTEWEKEKNLGILNKKVFTGTALLGTINFQGKLLSH